MENINNIRVNFINNNEETPFTPNFVLYIEYDEPLFNTFEIKTITRRDRGRIESSKYFHIPIKLLNPILYEYH